MADIEMMLTNLHGTVAGAAKQQLLQEIEEYRISTQRRIQQDVGALTQLENIYGGTDTKGSIE